MVMLNITIRAMVEETYTPRMEGRWQISWSKRFSRKTCAMTILKKASFFRSKVAKEFNICVFYDEKKWDRWVGKFSHQRKKVIGTTSAALIPSAQKRTGSEP